MQLSCFKREDFAYQAAFCEENIWHLCQQNDLQNSYVVFIFSEGDEFPMLNQRASGHPALPIFWDYHVVLLVMAESNQIFDFDTRLPFHTDIEAYFADSFIDERFLSNQETPLFRLVPADEFTKSFSSDRRHMQTPTGWHAPPPNWPTIGNMGSNLADFIHTEDNHMGELLNADAMLSRFIDSSKKSQ
jgi:hypothetical protein